MTVMITPKDFAQGGWFVGTVYSNGYNYPINVHALHLGSGERTDMQVLIGQDGKFTTSPIQLKTAGYWQFWATSDAVNSNKEIITVRGIRTGIDPTFYSRAFPMEGTIKVYSHYKNTNVGVVILDHARGISTPIYAGSTDSNGFLSIKYTPTGFVNGDYEVEAVFSNGDKATNYGATAWFEVGR
jgi:hypothetical protein